MARGQRCPKCGRLTFQEDGQIRKCSDKSCGVVGWLSDGPKKSSTRGRVCEVCGTGTMKSIGTVGKVSINHCFTCDAVYLV
jgi:hypothetical protein